MTHGLSREYLSLLIALQEKPLGTIEELAEKTDASNPTVAKRLRELEAKLFFYVKPILKEQSLGLELIEVMVEPSDYQSLKFLEKLGDDHPYTAYRGRCFGKMNGLHMQFRIPYGTKALIDELFNSLVTESKVIQYTILPTENCYSTYTSMRIKGWDSEAMTWKFDWNDWFKKKVSITSPQDSNQSTTKSPDWFDKKDAYILHELMRNSRRKNLDIIERIQRQGVEITPQTFSRRIQRMKDECIQTFVMDCDPGIFDIYNTVLIRGQADDGHINELWSRLKKVQIPFASTFKICGNELSWWIRLQSSHLSTLISNIYAKFQSMSVCLVDYSHTKVYYLWPETYDEDNNQWRTDREFMIDSLLK